MFLWMKQDSNLYGRHFKPVLYHWSYSSIYVGPERLELSTPGVKDRYSAPFELRTNSGEQRGSNPVLLIHNQALCR